MGTGMSSLRSPERGGPRTGGRLALAVAALVAALVSGPIGPARAQTDPMVLARAQALFDEGMALFNRGEFDKACPKFEESLSLVPGIGTRGKLAECYERQGRTASAWRLYKEVEQLARQVHDTRRADVAAERVEALSGKLARLVVKPGPSAGLTGFELRENSGVLTPLAYGSERVVDPGTHVIIATASGHKRWTKTITLKAGQTKTVQVPELTPMTTPAGRLVQPYVGAPLRINKGRTLAVAIIGFGAVSLFGGTTYFGLQARKNWKSAEGECDSAGLCTPSGKQSADRAYLQANLANLSAGLGIVALAGGGYLWWRYKCRSPGKERLQVTPVVQPGAVGLAVSRAF